MIQAIRYYIEVEGREDPELNGLYQALGGEPRQLANFTLRVDREVRVHDEHQPELRFECTVRLLGRDHPLTMAAGEFADPRQLRGRITGAAGSKARFPGAIAAIQEAASLLSTPGRVERTRDLGWTADGTAFLVPLWRIDAAGFHPYADDDLRVELEDGPITRHLGLHPPDPERLPTLKRHIAEDLIGLHDRTVMSGLVGAAALAVLVRFAPPMSRPALWLRGTAGGGKSFAANLVANFFGDFPPEDGSRTASWTSTANFLQHQGHAFKDALYLVDDYKPESTRHNEVVRLLQNYADGSARGRLTADVQARATLPIRGLLLATGEDLPEHTASSVARTIAVDVPAHARDVVRGRRCRDHRVEYPGVMADFVRWLLAEARPPAFAARVGALRDRYLDGIAGAQNDLRIAGNLALLGAAFEEFARYLGDAWPGREAAAAAFVEEDLVALRDAMVATVGEQQASEVLLGELRALLEFGVVRLERAPGGRRGGGEVRPSVPVVGRLVALHGHGEDPDPICPPPELVFLSTSRAVARVQHSLREQHRPPLAASDQALICQLAEGGRLVDRSGNPIDPRSGRKSGQLRLDGKSVRGVYLEPEVLGLMGPEPTSR